MHVDEIELVVHIDPPSEHKAYLHRSGRTARAGNAGDVVTVVLPEQRSDTQALLRKAGIHVTPQQVAADSPQCTRWSVSPPPTRLRLAKLPRRNLLTVAGRVAQGSASSPVRPPTAECSVPADLIGSRSSAKISTLGRVIAQA